MTRRKTIKHEFVDSLPEKLEDGVLYISIPFATSAHLCSCGCHREVNTPLSPTGWRLSFDGETVSLHPSIGNWNFPCQSHYWIENDRIEWAAKWSRWRIDAGRARDARERDRYYGPTNPDERDE